MHKTFRAYNIKYDTDGERVEGLPSELTFTVDEEDFNPSIDLGDMISDKTGWCVNGFSYEELSLTFSRPLILSAHD